LTGPTASIRQHDETLMTVDHLGCLVCLTLRASMPVNGIGWKVQRKDRLPSVCEGLNEFGIPLFCAIQ